MEHGLPSVLLSVSEPLLSCWPHKPGTELVVFVPDVIIMVPAVFQHKLQSGVLIGTGADWSMRPLSVEFATLATDHAFAIMF